MDDTKKVAVINLKGGVGKSTVTLALATMLAGAFDKRVLVIDLDPQTNSTIMLIGEDKWKALNDQGSTLHSFFKAALDGTCPVDINSIVQHDVSNIRDVTGIDLLPSSLDMVDLQDRIGMAGQRQFNWSSPTDILMNAIGGIEGDYDYIIIDCPPNLGLITLNGLQIADGFVIPTIPDYLSTYGIPQIVNRVKRFSENIGRNVQCYGVIPTRVRTQSRQHMMTIDRLRKGYDAPCFDSILCESTRISEAAEYQAYNTLHQKWGYMRQYEQLRSLASEFMWRTGA